jgi:hypothetical protein
MAEPTSPKIGTLLWLIIFIVIMCVYILLVTRLIDAFFAGNILMEMISYILVGILWIFPAKWIIFKLNRTDQTGNE